MFLKENELLTVYNLLLQNFGEQHWWPAETEFEVIVGAILTQSVAWKNVEKAIGNLKTAGLMAPERLHSAKEVEIAGLIRPTIYYNVKAKKLKAFLEFLHEEYEGDLDALLAQDVQTLRKQLLSVWGIGPETADSIVLYAAGKPSFVVDAYTRRIFSRLGFTKKHMDYRQVKEFFEVNLPRDVQLYNEFHALIVAFGKDFCRPKPLCSECCLKKVCKNLGE